jgi:hypothetical protein
LQLIVQVVTGDMHNLRQFIDLFGGKLIPVKPRVDGRGLGRKRQLYLWRLSGERAIAFLRIVLPWLREKRFVAQCALQWQMTEPGQRLLTPEQKRGNEVLADHITAFNQRVTI